ncbi:MAG: hypothetical protein GF346_08670, partial [Candidatus Eisenbacteria bacterium]|nr:hypothetical protein [Candidatus Latescibacterota bacterium]MBD3302508.1 hypothetical protein [Candidatus Eisenbacteria bacterium]
MSRASRAASAPQAASIRSPLLTLVVVLTALGLDGSDLRACTCVTQPDPLVAMGRADIVFEGTVTGRNDPRADNRRVSTGDPIDYAFHVAETWKGVLNDTIAVRTARSGASCGYEFEVGGSYLVYARKDSLRFRTGLCTRTKPLERASADLGALSSLGIKGEEAVVDRALVDRFATQIATADSAGRMDAVKALRRIGKAPEVAIPTLRSLFDSGSPEERAEAVSAMGS